MNVAEHYRTRAAEFHAEARLERSRGRRSQLETLARDYLRLAAQAQYTSSIDIMAESEKKTPRRLYSMNRFRGLEFDFQDGRPR